MHATYLQFITATLTHAAEIARKNFGIVTSTVKQEDNNQVLTATDIEIGDYLVKAVKETFPTHNIIDEEAGVIDNQSEFTWVIDPIDGTSNFANGIPTYGVMIGLLQDDTPVAGGVALPSFDMIYTALKGEGAYRNGERIRVSATAELLSSLVAYGIDGHQEEPSITHKETATLAALVLGIRNLRSSNSVYDFMLVADGRYGGYMNQTSKIWDNVAPQIIVQEAGGIFTDFNGNAIDYSNPLSKANENYTMCCGAPLLHEQLQNIIHVN